VTAADACPFLCNFLPPPGVTALLASVVGATFEVGMGPDPTFFFGSSLRGMLATPTCWSL